MKQVALQDDSKDLDAVETAIVHHPYHDQRSFIDRWEFVMLLVVGSIVFGFILGLGLKFVL